MCRLFNNALEYKGEAGDIILESRDWKMLSKILKLNDEFNAVCCIFRRTTVLCISVVTCSALL